MLRRSFALRTLLLLVAVTALSLAVGRYFIPECDHVVVLTPTFRGPFEYHIVADGMVHSCGTGAENDGQYLVEFQLEELEGWRNREIPWVRRGLSVRINDLDSGDKLGDGQVTAIGPKRLKHGWGKSVVIYPVRVDITALKSRIRDGDKVEVRIPVQKQRDALQVPIGAVIQAGDAYVIVKKGRRLEPRRIHLKVYNARYGVVDESLSDPLPVGASVMIPNSPYGPLRDALYRYRDATAKGGTYGRFRMTLDCSICGRALSHHCRPSPDR